MREKLETLPLTQLRELARGQGIKNVSGLRKSELVDRLCEVAERENAAEAEKVENAAGTEKTEKTEKAEPTGRQARAEKGERKERAERPEQTDRQERGSVPAQNASPSPTGDPRNDLQDLDSGIEANGILEVMPDGFGFIRCENFLPGENDVYVAPSQIRRFNMKTGDIIRGSRRVKTATEKFAALLYVTTING